VFVLALGFDFSMLRKSTPQSNEKSGAQSNEKLSDMAVEEPDNVPIMNFKCVAVDLDNTMWPGVLAEGEASAGKLQHPAYWRITCFFSFRKRGGRYSARCVTASSVGLAGQRRAACHLLQKRRANSPSSSFSS
jgi:hypothetical protein